MRVVKLLVTAAAVTLAVPAFASVIVLGSSAARLCYEAAEAKTSPARSMLEDCDRALHQEGLDDHDRVATHVNRGILRLRLGRVGEAIRDFDTAIAEDPNQPEAYLNKGVALLRLERGYDDAVPLFSTALEKQTRRPAIAYYARGVAHELSGQLKLAYRDYKQASVIEPEWREPREELARFVVRK